MGLVMVIVAKHGILLLGRGSAIPAEGLLAEESMIPAGGRRLRPIMMTALALSARATIRCATGQRSLAEELSAGESMIRTDRALFRAGWRIAVDGAGEDARANPMQAIAKRWRGHLRVFFEKRQHVSDVVLSLARPALRFLRRCQLERDQAGNGRDPQTHAPREVNGDGMFHRVRDTLVLSGELHRRPRHQRAGARRAPVVAVRMASRVFETGAEECRARNLRVRRDRQVDVERTPRFFGMKLNRDAADEGVWHALPLEQLRDETERLFLRIPFRQGR